MTSEVMDCAYKQEGAFPGPPPWNIGEPQPELATVIGDGKVSGDVLDAGMRPRRIVVGASLDLS